MRDIKFRGKHIKTGEWIVTRKVDLIPAADGSIYLYDEDKKKWCRVDPKTLGQYMGFSDKNDDEIFEGDIVEWYFFRLMRKVMDVATLDSLPVFWLKNEQFGYEGEDLVDPEGTVKIANVHDNPELLEG